MKRYEALVSGQSSGGDYHISHCLTVVSAMLCSNNLLDVIIKHEEEDKTYISPLLKLDHPFRRIASPRCPPFNVLRNLLPEYTRISGLIINIYFLYRFTICTQPSLYKPFMCQSCVLSVVKDTQ